MNYLKECGVQASDKEPEAVSLGTKAPPMCYNGASFHSATNLFSSLSQRMSTARNDHGA